MRYTSETARFRAMLEPYCQGNGLDVGSGGDPIRPSSISVETWPHADCGDAPIELVADDRRDAKRLDWFRSNTLSYLYSSHTLEDFEDTLAVLREWVRVIMPGGFLVLVLPDQQKYEAHCRATGQEPNPSHKHAHFGMVHVRNLLRQIAGVEVVSSHEDDGYSFALVVRKVRDGRFSSRMVNLVARLQAVEDRLARPLSILEIGSARNPEEAAHFEDGHSTLYLAEWVADSRYPHKFTTVDVETAVCEDLLARRGLAPYAKLVRSDSSDYLAKARGKIDFALLDGSPDPEKHLADFKAITRRAGRDGVVFAFDDVSNERMSLSRKLVEDRGVAVEVVEGLVLFDWTLGAVD